MTAEEKILRVIVLPSVTQQAKELAALVPPKGDEAKIKALVAAYESGRKKAEAHPYYLETGGPSKYPLREAAELARAYGFRECRIPALRIRFSCWPLFPAILLAFALLAAGCGDSPRSTSMTKAEFIKRADLICRRADEIQGREREPYIARHKRELDKMTGVEVEEKLIKTLEFPTMRMQIRET